LWLTAPRDLQTGQPRRRLWWWLLPLIVLTALYESQLRKLVTALWVCLLPFLAQPSGFDLGSLLATPEAKAQMIGNWPVLALFVISALFNTVLGEELLFRGLLLPRMTGAFGKWDWAMNGILFGLYHLHQPWGIPGSVISGVFCYALPSRHFRSAWFGIIAHSGQSLFFTFLLLGLVLGLA
jgi:membrane protease YdiL (CAAX protease family)